MCENRTREELASVRPTTQVFKPAVDVARIKYLARELLLAIGEDPEREGIRDTPNRYARWWQEFIEYDAGKTNTAFECSNDGQMVIVAGMRVWSLCEHHLIPFWCDVSVGYIAKDKVLGLSKFGRIAHKYAHRLQIQEQLTNQIAEEIMSVTESPDVAVMSKGQHLCMLARGIQTNATMICSSFHGSFKENHHIKAQFLSQIK